MHPNIEAVVLTGGASIRMGQNKAELLIDGIPMAQRIVQELADIQLPITVLGRNPIEGAQFQMDLDHYGGPLAALAGFTPKKDLVFVTSCDLPLFDARVVHFLYSRMFKADGVVPIINGRHQPLCALYQASSLAIARGIFALGERRIMKWLDRLELLEVNEADFINASIPTVSVMGVNTREEFERIVSKSLSES